MSADERGNPTVEIESPYQFWQSAAKRADYDNRTSRGLMFRNEAYLTDHIQPRITKQGVVWE